VILRKPFDPIEVRQLASCLSEKWLRGRVLARRMEELEAQVASEVGRRMHNELQQSQKFEALGRLAAGIAHEINTPSQYIQSSVEFVSSACTEIASGLHRMRARGMRDPELDTLETLLAEIPNALADAEQGISRVSAIVRSVREYAHTSNRGELEPVDINRQIHMVAELARNQYKNEAELVLELGAVPEVPGNADELGRALLNLLLNAVQAIQAARNHGPRGRITITTRASTAAVMIDIADTGIGIRGEHRSRVFEPFFTTKPRGQGTGQGLAIAYAAIVERHRGTLDFDSIPNHGTTFHVSLPLAVPRGVTA
jgi:two-component system NtrC family sensor kinase